MIKIFKRLENSSGEVIIAVSIGMLIFSFAFLAVQDFGQGYIKPYLDAKKNNPDAVISIELENVPKYEDYIIRNGIIQNINQNETNNTNQSIYDEDSEISARYQGPKNNKPKKLIPIKPSYSGKGISVFDDGSTWKDLFPEENPGINGLQTKGRKN